MCSEFIITLMCQNNQRKRSQIMYNLLHPSRSMSPSTICQAGGYPNYMEKTENQLSRQSAYSVRFGSKHAYSTNTYLWQLERFCLLIPSTRSACICRPQDSSRQSRPLRCHVEILGTTALYFIRTITSVRWVITELYIQCTKFGKLNLLQLLGIIIFQSASRIE